MHSRSAVAEPVRGLTKHVVAECADEAAALRLAREQDYDLILLVLGDVDVAAPESAGFDALRSLRLEPRTRDVPLLVLTSTQEGVAGRLKQVGLASADVILCPIGVDQVIRRVEATRCLAYTFEIGGRFSTLRRG